MENEKTTPAKKSKWTKPKKQKAAIIVLAVALVGVIAYHVLDKQGYIAKWKMSMKAPADNAAETEEEKEEGPNG